MPFGSSRSTAISKLKTLLNRTTGLPYNMHLTGIGGYDKTLSVGSSQINSFASDGEYLYACVYQIPGQIVRISLKTFTVEATLTFSVGVAPVVGSALTSIVIAGGGDGENYLYAVAYDNPCLVYKILLSSFTKIATLTLTTSSGYSLATDGEYLYVGHGRYITRINIETFTETSILDTGEFAGINTRPLLCLGSYLYAGSNSAPAKLIKIDTDTFTITSNMGFAENWADSLTTDGTYIYVGVGGTIKKIDVLSFTEIGSITLAGRVYALICDSTNLYCGLDTAPGQIAIIDLSTFQFIDTITTSGNQIRSLYYDDAFLYYGFYASDGVEKTYIIPESSADSKRIATMNLDIVTLQGDVTILQDTIVSSMKFHSNIDETISLTTATADVNLINVSITLPANITVIRVYGWISIRAFDNTSVSVNAINGDATINIKKSNGVWGVDDIPLIDIQDGIWSTKASTKENGMTLHSKNSWDVASVVNATGTYNIRFNGNIFVDANNLDLIDVTTGLIIYFKPT